MTSSQAAQLAQPTEGRTEEMNLELLQNVTVTLSIEVGRSVLKIRDLLRLGQGSVVELDRVAGEPLDVCVNNVVVAKGEVVLVNERYGIRLTQVVEPADRLRTL
jgi:flagellar motor switch protein FliN/FliY